MDKKRQTLITDISTRSDIIWRKYNILFPELRVFNKPAIMLNNRIYRTAGRCIVEDNIVELSSRLFINNYSAMLDIILPHEIAHQIDYNLNGLPNRWHGKSWQYIMESFGLPADTYHTLEI